LLNEKARVRKEEEEEKEKEEKAALRKKERMVAENRGRADREKQLQLKIAANVFAGKYVMNLQESVFEGLRAERFFFDPIAEQANALMPWLTEKVCGLGEDTKEQQYWVDKILATSLAKIKTDATLAFEERRAQRAAEAAAAEAARLAAEEEARRGKVLKLMIHADFIEEAPVKIKMRADSTVQQVQDKVVEWMRENMADNPELTRLERIQFQVNNVPLPLDGLLLDLGDKLEQLQMVVLPEPEEGAEGDAAEGDANADEEN
jgi:hypothetical protein